MSRAPSNLLQWLRWREHGRRRDLPVRIISGLLTSRSIRREEGIKKYVLVVMLLTKISKCLQFQSSFNSSWYRLALMNLQDLWVKIIHPANHLGREYLKDALDNGLLMIMKSFVLLVHSPCIKSNVKGWIRPRAMMFFSDLSFLIKRFGLDQYQHKYVLTTHDILLHSKSITISMSILTIHIRLPEPMGSEFFKMVSLKAPLRQESKDLYPLFEKFKEAIYHSFLTFQMDVCYHCVIRMDGVIEKIVHEAYCTASCVESIFRLEETTETIHKLYFASNKLQELLWIISELLIVYPEHCKCADCSILSQRLVKAGVPRLFYVLTSVMTSLSDTRLSFIEPFAETLADLIAYFTQFSSPHLVVWYTLYTLTDMERLISICSNEWNTTSDAIYFRSILLNAYKTVSKTLPVEYILHPMFHDIPFQLNREVPPYEPLLSIRKLNLDHPVLLPMKGTISLMEDKIEINWLDREFWKNIFP